MSRSTKIYGVIQFPLTAFLSFEALSRDWTFAAIGAFCGWFMCGVFVQAWSEVTLRKRRGVQ